MSETAPDIIRERLRAQGRARNRSRQAETRSLAGIADALSDGRQQGMSIKEMAQLAGIARQTAYTLLERSVR